MGRRIFIYHDGALGDLLLSLPAINALRRQGDSVYLAGRKDVVDFLKKIGYIHYGFRAGSRLFLPFFTGKPDKEIEEHLSGFEKVYVFTSDRSSGVASNIRFISHGAGVIMTIPPPGFGMHVSDFRLKQVVHGSKSSIPGCYLAIPPSCQEGAMELLRKCGYDFEKRLVAIHPGSGSRKKCWPLSNFKELIIKLSERDDCFFMIFSGPAEGREMQDEIAGFLKGREETCLHIAGHDLTTVASLLSLSHVYIGNDSGITHLASSVMKGRVIAIFGPTDPLVWGPISNRAVIIFSDMECAPCEPKSSGESFHRLSDDCGIKCLSDIEVERVILIALEVP